MNRNTRDRQLQIAVTSIIAEYDQDKKGYLDRGEVYSLLCDSLQEWGLDASHLQRIGDLVDRLDDAFDGKISKDGVAAIIKGAVEKRLMGD